MSIWTKIKTKWDAWRLQQRLKRLELYLPLYCKVHGVATPERQGALAQTRAGDRLQIVHVPLPDYPNNIYVYSIPLNRVLGYLQGELAKKLVKAFGENLCLDGVVENTTGGKPGEFIGCNLCIFPSMRYMEDEVNFNALHGE